jgi:hypothetical protein
MHHDVVTKSKMDDQHMVAKYLNAASSARIYACNVHGNIHVLFIDL